MSEGGGGHEEQVVLIGILRLRKNQPQMDANGRESTCICESRKHNAELGQASGFPSSEVRLASGSCPTPAKEFGGMKSRWCRLASCGSGKTNRKWTRMDPNPYAVLHLTNVHLRWEQLCGFHPSEVRLAGGSCPPPARELGGAKSGGAGGPVAVEKNRTANGRKWTRMNANPCT